MYSFKNDYSEGAHPNIIEALVGTNLEQTDGYGEDFYTREASLLIKERIKREDVDVHIFVQEIGAIEATSHKIIAVPSADGKIKILTSIHF